MNDANRQNSFLPTSAKEMKQLGWDQADVILITGDAYIDHPSFGTAIIGRLLEAEGLRVAVVPQPNWRDDLRDFKKLGAPRLFFSVAAGSMDSMVNHYTATKRKRSDDAYTPEGRTGQRPDNASVVYCNILKEIYPDVPVVLGGVEASMRRCVHYDYWKNEVVPSILVDSKADMLTYGMAEESLLEILHLMLKGVPFSSITTVPQTVVLADKVPNHKQWTDVELHSFEKNKADKRIFAEDFKTIEINSNPYLKRRLIQPHDSRFLMVNPPYPPMSEKVLDRIYDLPYTRLPHPRYNGKRIPAFDMIKHSVTTHRGCFGGCSFCAIYAHQGKFIVSRSQASIFNEVDSIVKSEHFKGIISDLGGASANMYRMGGEDKELCKKCRRVSCLFPRMCKNLRTDHTPITAMYRKVSEMEQVKHCFSGSGIRYDMLIDEKGNPLSKDKAQYIRRMIAEHTSGRMTVAPEHTSDRVLKLMGKPSYRYFEAFQKLFEQIIKQEGKKYQLVPYFISSHPGSKEEDMAELAVIAKNQKMFLEQVQDFTPTPMTLSTTMYYSGINPYTGDPIYVAKSKEEKQNQKRFFFWYKKEEQRAIRNELRKIERRDLENQLFGKELPRQEGRGDKSSHKKSFDKGKAHRDQKPNFKGKRKPQNHLKPKRRR